jgi:beta-lactamase class D
VEQVAFLQRLFRNALPFRVEHQRLVKDVMINEAGRDWILRAKTGWTGRVPPQIGWWVGWVERPDGAVFFALNIDMAGAADAPKREAIARAILTDIGALPAAARAVEPGGPLELASRHGSAGLDDRCGDPPSPGLLRVVW